jgi:hypothetical protein
MVAPGTDIDRVIQRVITRTSARPLIEHQPAEEQQQTFGSATRMTARSGLNTNGPPRDGKPSPGRRACISCWPSSCGADLAVIYSDDWRHIVQVPAGLILDHIERGGLAAVNQLYCRLNEEEGSAR